MSNKDILEPEYSPCSICNDDGECLANENHPDYVEDIWDDLTYFDCWNYILRRDAKNREGTIIKVKDMHNKIIKVFFILKCIYQIY